MSKVKPTKEELVELATRTIGLLEERVKELRGQIALYEAKVSDAEKKIRWLKREILECE